MRYRVELDELLAFADKLQAFERRAEALATQIDQRIAGLHETWSGSAATAHRAQHDEWMAGATQMRRRSPSCAPPRTTLTATTATPPN